MLPGAPWLVYQAAQDAGDGIFLAQPDGSASHALPGPWSGRATHPDWSPDGSLVAFEWATDDGAVIEAAAPDGMQVAVLARATGCGTGCNDWIGYPAWSHDGALLAYTRIDDDGSRVVRSTLEIVELATGVARVVYTAPEGTVLANPRWSPADDQLVFGWIAYRDDFGAGAGTAAAIAVLDLRSTGVEPRDLTDSAMFAAYPDWHPATSQIVFTTYDGAEYQQTDEPSNLYLIQADGSGLLRITDYGRADRRATQPTWTPDGLRIVFTLMEQGSGAFDGRRRAAFIGPDGSGLEIVVYGTHPRLRPAS